MDQYLAAVLLFGGNFAPRGFALCAGQLMAISQNTALFSLVGTYYGGDGRSTFGLPNLQGRFPIGQGNGAGLSQYVLGEESGTNTVTLLTNQLPFHNHSVNAYNLPGNTNSPVNAVLAEGPKASSAPTAPREKFYNSSAPNVTLAPTVIGFNNSGAQAITTTQPYMAITHIIATQGIFPPRS